MSLGYPLPFLQVRFLLHHRAVNRYNRLTRSFLTLLSGIQIKLGVLGHIGWPYETEKLDLIPGDILLPQYFHEMFLTNLKLVGHDRFTHKLISEVRIKQTFQPEIIRPVDC